MSIAFTFVLWDIYTFLKFSIVNFFQKNSLHAMNTKKTFVEAVSLKMVSSNSFFPTITDSVCSSGHDFRKQMFVKLYHCFIKNFLKRINHRVGAKTDDRKIKKLSSMTSK